MQGVTLALNGQLTGDAVTVSGSGAFSQSNVGSNLGYAISGLSLGSADGIDYFLLGGTAFSGTNGAINQRPLTVTADPKSKTYGDANPALTYTVTPDGTGTSRGLVTGENLSGALSTAATLTSNVGSYTIDASALANGNYLITANNGTLAIAKAPLTATGNSLNTTYNAGTQSVSGVALTGLKGSDTVASLTGLSASGASAKNAGSYTNTVADSGETNYTVSTINGTLNIAKADATVTANSANVTYNGATQTVTGFTATGLVGGETAAVLSGVTASGSGTNAGSYPSTASGTDSNYALKFVPGNLSISTAIPPVVVPGGNSGSGTETGGTTGTGTSGGGTGTGSTGSTTGIGTGNTSGSGTDTSGYSGSTTGTGGTSNQGNGGATSSGTGTSGSTGSTSGSGGTGTGSGTGGSTGSTSGTGGTTGTSDSGAGTGSNRSATETGTDPTGNTTGTGGTSNSGSGASGSTSSGTGTSGSSGSTTGTGTSGSGSSTAGSTGGTSNSSGTSGGGTGTGTSGSASGSGTGDATGTSAGATGDTSGTGTSGTGSTGTGTSSSSTDTSGSSGSTAGPSNQGTGGAGTSSSVENGTGTDASRSTLRMNLVKDASVNESGLLMVYVPSTVHAASEGFVFRLPAQIVTSIPEGTRVEITTVEGNALPTWLNFDLPTRTFNANAVPAGALPLRVVVHTGSRRPLVVPCGT